MSQSPPTNKDQKVLSAPNRPPPRTFGGGPFGGGGMTEKPMNFGPSARRLMGRLRPESARLIAVLALGITSVALMVIGPRIIGQTNFIVNQMSTMNTSICTISVRFMFMLSPDQRGCRRARFNASDRR